MGQLPRFRSTEIGVSRPVATPHYDCGGGARSHLCKRNLADLAEGEGIEPLEPPNRRLAVFETVADFGLCLQMSTLVVGARPYARQPRGKYGFAWKQHPEISSVRR
jgi:hypothetical protein